MSDEKKRFQSWPTLAGRVVCSALATLLITGCEKPQKKNPDEESGISISSAPLPETGVVQTPVDRAVTDKKGRSIDVRILSRTGTTVKMVRLEDKFPFDLPIKDLSEADRQFVLRIAESKAAPVPDDPYVRSRKEALKKLSTELEVLEIELKTITVAKNRNFSNSPLGPSSGAQISLKKREVAAVKAEIARLEGQIEIYNVRNR